MKTPRLTGSAAALAAALTGVAPAPELAAAPFGEAVFTQVVNQVEVLEMPSRRAAPAAIDGTFRAPDILRTGPGSRAEMKAADGTVTRVGSNTLFSFDPERREINLRRGTVLFTSPTGVGGGRIRTPAATATVVGTTIMVASTQDGGFKVMVLEGVAEVDYEETKDPKKKKRKLRPGQLTFILPDTTSRRAARGFPRGRPGPVLDVDLKKTVQGAKLVNGFAKQMMSMGKIQAATQIQQQAKESGELAETGVLVVEAASSAEVVVVDSSLLERSNAAASTVERLQFALTHDEMIDEGMGVPPDFVFAEVVSIPRSQSAFLSRFNPYTGLIGNNLTFDASSVDFSPFDGLAPAVAVAAKGTLRVERSLTVDGLAESRQVRVLADAIELVPGVDVSTNFAAGLPTLLSVSTASGFRLDDNGLANDTGGVFISAEGGALALDNGSTVTAGAGDLIASARSVEVARSNLSAGGLVALRGSVVSLADTGVFGSAMRIAAESGERLISLQGTAFDRRLLNINLDARTIALRDVDFPGGSTVNLSSQFGRLAADPNTGRPVQPGFVNFVRNVNYDGQPAQAFVPVSAGGTGSGPALPINISASPN